MVPPQTTARSAQHALCLLQGHCWLEGDNADLSEDSRSKYGAVCRLQLYVHDVLHHRDHTHLLVCRSSVQRI